MNLSALKSFAPEVRRQLMDAVGRKLDYVLSADTADLRAAAPQVLALRQAAAHDRAGLIERVAYTWFNRLAALRFLDARGWHRFGARVLTPATPEETQPELLKLLRTGALPAEIAPHTDLARLNALLDGRLPTATAGADPQGEAYRQLILATCRFYHEQMPFLFESIDDETELLLPDDLLTAQSVAQGFRDAISDEDCGEVEVLGWLYQFYISEKKDQVMARKKAVPSEDIPAVTQLFTPHWIVRYLVENSLGRLWLHSRPSSALKAHMPYYIDDPDGQPPADSLTVTGPEEIKLIDPACGSGHMLTYAFDLLYAIYEEEGYAAADIPGLILQHNLHGLEICPRATQLAQFALLCKAREKSRLAFRKPIAPRVLCLQDVVIDEDELNAWLRATRLQVLFTDEVLAQLHQFRENTATYGSLIQPILSAPTLADLLQTIGEDAPAGELFLQETHRKIRLALTQAEMLTQRYHVVVANPPYMGGAQMSMAMRQRVSEEFEAATANLFASFILRNRFLVTTNGYIAMITLSNWLVLSDYEEIRREVLTADSLVLLLDNGRGVWGSDFESCSFVICRSRLDQQGVFRRLFRKSREVQTNQELERNFHDIVSFPEMRHPTSAFQSMPGLAIAYWASERTFEHFRNLDAFGDHASLKVGLQTGNNSRFLRRWHEVSRRSISFSGVGHQRWYPYCKGGEFRRWFGNGSYVIDWYDNGLAIRDYRDENGKLRSRPQNMDFYFVEAIEWSDVGQSVLGARYRPRNHHFDVVAMSAFERSESNLTLWEMLSFLNSAVVGTYMNILAPGMHYNTGYVGALPYKSQTETKRSVVTAKSSVEIARADWDNFETSWDFHDLPLLRSELKSETLEASWRNWEAHLRANIARMQELETENNRLWIQAYGLQDELTPEVPEEEITLARPDTRKDMAAFLSYAVGCMMGRYAVDAPGLILADAGATRVDYLNKLGKSLEEVAFTPDEDGIIPVLDGEWFEDDIVARARAFLRVTFGEAALADNLRFLESALGKDLRAYFATQFYKDHLQTYKKRPIYWLFQSPKKGFQCLIYMHRYTRDTVNLVLNRYLREYLSKLRARIDQLEGQLTSESLSAREKARARKESDQLKKTLRECEDWERDVLLPLAQQRIEIDLDDGVKVNYLKFGAALAPIPGLEAKEEE